MEETGRTRRPRTGFRGRLAAGFLVLVGLAAGLTAGGEAEAQTSTEPIWTATLTVGQTSNGDGNRAGYYGWPVGSPVNGGKEPTLSSNSFTHGDTEYSWWQILEDSSTEVELQLEQLTSFGRKLRLCLGGSAYVDWNAPEISGARKVTIINGPLSWTVGETVNLKLIETTQSCAPPAVTLESSLVTQNTATLTISGHTTGWWYKRTNPASTTCTGVNAGTSTANLASLTAGTSYTYEAYSDSTCSTKLADETFMTEWPPLSWTATLTVGNDSDGRGYRPDKKKTGADAVPGALSPNSISYRGETYAVTQLLVTESKQYFIVSGLPAVDTTFKLCLDGTSAGTKAWLDGTAQSLSGTTFQSDWAIGQTVKVALVESSAACPAGAGTRPTATMSAESITDTGARLRFAKHPIVFALKQISPTEGNCGVDVLQTGLTPDTEYTFATFFANTACATNSKLAEHTFRTLLPSTLTNLTATAASAGNALDVSWTGVRGATSYKVSWRSGPGSTYPAGDTTTVTAPTTAATISGLTAGTSYTVKVEALDSNGAISGASATTTGTPTAAAAPIWTATMTVWNDSNNAKNAQGYSSDAAGVPPSTIVPGTISHGGTTYTVTHLYDNSNNRFRATTSVSGIATPFKLCLDGVDAGTKAWLNGSYLRFTRPTTAWVRGQTVKVALVAAGASCPADTGTLPSLAAEDVSSTGATLKIGNRPTNWYHKRTSPTTPAASCSAAQTGASATLSSLTPGTDYTWGAFLDSTCTDDNKFKDVSFSTLAAANSPATGAPSITGTPQVGQTLTASKGNIADTDGLPATDAGYTYRWIRVTNGTDADITGATGSGTTYTVTSADLGKTLKVRATFTDGGGTSESRTSAATAAVTAAAPPPTPALVSNFGQQHASRNVPLNSTFSREQSFTTGSHAPGYDLESIEIRVFQDYDLGTAKLYSGNTLVATLTTPARPGGGISDTHTITYAAPAGTKLAAGTTYRLGLTCSVSACFRWRRAGNDNEDAGASPGWSIADGSPFTIRVKGSDATGVALAAESVTTTGATLKIFNHAAQWWHKRTSPTTGSPSCVSVAANTATDTITGLTPGTDYTFGAFSDNACTAANKLAEADFSTQLPSTLTDLEVTAAANALGVDWTGVQGAAKYRVSWRSGSTFESGDTATVTAPTTAAVIPGLVAGTAYTVKVEALDGSNAAISGASATATGTPAAATGDATGLTVTGTPQVGQTLMASGITDDDGLTGATFMYQWIRVDSDGSSNPADITGATGASYAPVAGDVGKRLKVKVDFTDDLGNPESLTSAATAAVTAAAAPTLSESAVKQTTATLTLSNHAAAWYLKQTVPAPPAPASCEAFTATTRSTNLANLQPGTAYTFKAYSDSGCNTEIASVTFTTQDLADVLTVSQATLTIKEGASDTFTVVLSSQPTASVTVHVSSRDTRVATVNPRSLTFTTSTWNTAQSVTVTGVQDTVLNTGGGREAKIQLNASSTQDAFNLGTGQDLVTVTVTDDEMPGVTAPEARITDTGARLTVTHHPGSWHYKQTSPATTPAATCQGPVTARSRTLSGLTALTEYTFETYSDSACAMKLADVTFTTDPAPLVLGTVATQGWTIHHDVDLELPEATGGTPSLNYALTGTLPAGLSFDAATRKITGTPTALAGARTLTYTVTDSATPTAKTTRTTFRASVARDTTRPTIVSVAGDPDTGGLSPTVRPFGLLVTTSERVCIYVDDVFTTTGAASIGARTTETATCGSASGTFPKGTKTDAGWVYAFDIQPSDPEGASTVTAVVDATELIDRSGNFGSGGTRTVRFNANIFVALSVPSQTDKAFAVNEAVPDGAWTSAFSGKLYGATGGTGTINYVLTGPSGTAAVPNLPAGLTFDAANLLIKGTPTTAGTTELTLTATDSATTPVSKSTKFDVTVAARPMVALAATPAVLGTGDTATVTVTFPEAAARFPAEIVTLSCNECTAMHGAFTANAAKTVWTATLTPPKTGHGTITLSVTGNTWASPTTGLRNAAGSRVEVEYDNRKPKPAITVDDSVLGIGETATVTVTFAEAVTRKADEELTASASGGGTATLTNLAAATGANAGKVWTATLTPPATEEGTITLGLPAGFGTSDRTGNGSAAADQLTVTYDTLAPTVTIEAGGEAGDALAGDNTLNKGESVKVTVTFSEQVTGFVAAELTKTAGTLTHDSSTGQQVYTYTLAPPATGSGSITLGVAADVATDGAGNGNTAATSVTVAYDNTVLGAPTGMTVVPGDDEPATSLKVEWTAAADATGYTVQWKAPGESYATTRQQAVTTTSHTITGLTTGTVYKVRVKSTRLNVPDSGWSDEMEGSPYAGPIDIVLSRETVTVCEDPDDSLCGNDVEANSENGQGAGGTATYTVRLNTPPEVGSADVKVKVLEHSRRLSVSPETLTFTRANWSVRQTVTVTAVQDDIAWEEDGQTVRIRHLRSGGGRREGISAQKVTATVHDDDTASVVIDTDPDTAGAQTDLEVDEGGTATYTIALTSQPRSRVHAYGVQGRLLVDGRRVFTNDPAIPAYLNGESSAYVRFTADNWRTPQTITVRGRRDGRKDGDRTATVKHDTKAGSYYGKPVADVNLTVKDTDMIRVYVYGGAVMPPGANRGWWVSFGSRTRSAVTLTLASSDPTVAVVDMDPGTPGDQKTLVLPPGNWYANNHLVRVRGVGDGRATVTVSAMSSTDPGFTGLEGAELGEVRVCAGVSYKGGVARCPGDTGYRQAQAEGEPETNAPAFTAEAEDQAAQVGEAFSYTVPEAADPQGDAIAYTAGLIDDQPLPDWLRFDPATRTFSGTPGAEDALAVLEIAVNAAETATELPLADRTVFTLTVAAADGSLPNLAPAFAEAAADQSATAGEAFSYAAPAAADPDEGDTLTYTAALPDGGALPAWLGFDPATRTFTGTPGKGDAPADLKIAVTATDDGDPAESATTTFALKVSPAAADCETAVTVGGAPVVLENEPWNAPDCRAHHRTDSPARYFRFTLKEAMELELELRTRETAALFVSTGRPANGWGTPARAGMEHRLKVRRANGKLAAEAVPPELPPGVNVAFALQVPVTLPAGTHTVEVVLAGEARENPPMFGLEIARKPAELSVADARAKEDAGSISFGVTLGRALGTRATVDWATSDGTAQAGSDYTAASGTLAFEAGETEKTVTVAILDDAHDEGEETFTLTLSNAAGAKLGDSTATGTIANEDPLLEAWLSRFGRSAASQTVRALEDRFAVPEGAGSYMTLGGRRIGLDGNTGNAGNAGNAGNPEKAATRGSVVVLVVPDGTGTARPAAEAGKTTVASAGKTPDPEAGKTTVASAGKTPDPEAGKTPAVEAEKKPATEAEKVYRWGVVGASHAELLRTGHLLTGAGLARAEYRVPGRRDVADRSAVDDGAWIEFERTATDAAGGVEARRVRVTVAGAGWKPGGPPADLASLATPGAPVTERNLRHDPDLPSDALAGRWGGPGYWERHALQGGGGSPVTMASREFLLGSSFFLRQGAGLDGSGGSGDSGDSGDSGGRWTTWGRAGLESFSGSGGGVSVDGEVTTAMFGTDWEHGRWLAGAALTHSMGDGGAKGAAGGPDYDIDSTVTSVNPYVRLRLSDRVTAWGIAGWGRGELDLLLGHRDPAGETDGTEATDPAAEPERYRTDLGMVLGAFGGRARLDAAAGGFGLALKGDALFVRTESDAVSVEGLGNLAEAAGEASRLRFGLEGTRSLRLSGGSVLAPGFEIGLRHDGGDAETGTGLEVGGSLAWSVPSRGLAVDLRARTLAAHADGGYDEWGVSGAVRLSPGARGLGPSLSLAPAWGGDAGGADRLWTVRDASQMVPGSAPDPSVRLNAEVGYGLPVRGGRFTGTPYAGLGYSDNDRRYRLGWRLERPSAQGSFRLSVEADRREAAGADPDHGIGLRFTIRF